MSAKRTPFQAYLAWDILSRLPWKRRFFNLFGARVAIAGLVLAAVRTSFLVASALGEARPDLVGPILRASTRPNGDAYAFGLERALELMNAAGGEPKSYDDLFPDDAEFTLDVEAWSRRKVLPFDFSFMLFQLRVVEGLVFGEQYPHVTRQLVEAELTRAVATRDRARAYGVDFGGAPWQHIRDVERDAEQIAIAWLSLEDTGVDPASR
jgi:hypothetical protein